MVACNISAERFRERVSYDPETGIFTNRIGGPRHRAGSVLGSMHSSGYLYICIDGYRTAAHRFAWLYMTGNFPSQYIDHINGCRTDNRFCNLRDVSRTINNQNQRGAQKSNLSCGLLGVSKDQKRGSALVKWRARIGLGNSRMGLGSFSTPEAAHAAYLEAKRVYHVEADITGRDLSGRPERHEEDR